MGRDNGGVGVGGGVGNYKVYDFVCVLVVVFDFGVVGFGKVVEFDGLFGVGGEVENDFIVFGYGDVLVVNWLVIILGKKRDWEEINYVWSLNWFF